MSTSWMPTKHPTSRIPLSRVLPWPRWLPRPNASTLQPGVLPMILSTSARDYFEASIGVRGAFGSSAGICLDAQTAESSSRGFAGGGAFLSAFGGGLDGLAGVLGAGLGSGGICLDALMESP